MPPTLERLTTERVPQKRWVPIAVAILTIGVVGVLVAKPWGSDPVRPGAATSPAAVASPTATPTSSPAATVRLLPTPDLAPLGPVGNYSIEFVRDGPMASCDYARPRRGVQHLTDIEVQPPTILVDYSEADVGNINSVGWSFELEMNRQETVFNREWETVARSRRQMAAAIDGRATAFIPMRIAYDARGDDPTAIYRARIVVEWLTRNLEIAGSVELVLTAYQEGDAEFDGSWSAHCSGRRAITR